MQQHYTGDNAVAEIKAFLEVNGFNEELGGLYIGNDSVNAVTVVLVVQELSANLPWLASCVTKIRMLRIEDNDDLKDVLYTA